MCGIAGFVGNRNRKKENIWEEEIRTMLDVIVHRGPDGVGIYRDELTETVLGHRRLSIIDLSKNGAQPMCSSNGRYVISYNGEIYNYRELKKMLASHNKTIFKSTTDTEILLEAFDTFGIDQTLAVAKGMFAIALLDRTERKLYLIRDRFGEKPLYYGFVDDKFFFCSDLNSIKAVAKNKLEIDIGALSEYFKYGYICGEHTIYCGLKNVIPGNKVIVDLQSMQISRIEYWSYRECLLRKPKFGGTINEAEEILSDLISNAVKQQLTSSDVMVGANLSGGIDSSLIVALAQQQYSGKINTFSIGFESKNYDESVYAKQMADYLGTDHHEMICSEKHVKQLVPHLAKVYGEPFADISEIPTMLVSQLAKNDVTVVLSGDGGDELFGGYSRYYEATDIFSRYKRGVLLKPIVTAISSSSLIRDERIRRHLEKTQWKSEEEVYEWLLQTSSNWNWIMNGSCNRNLDLKKYENERLVSCEKFMLSDCESYLPSDILVKVDRAGMYYSLENRIPFLDKDVAEFSASLPANFKLQGCTGKIVLKEILGQYVPVEYFTRPKKGFSMPISEWLRTDKELQEWAIALIDPVKLDNEGYLNTSAVQYFWNQLQKNGSCGSVVWTVLMFEQWMMN